MSKKVELSLGMQFIRFAQGQGKLHPSQLPMDRGEDVVTGMFADFGRDILQAERFVLSEEVADSVQDILLKNPFNRTIVDQRKMLKTPYPNTWVELSFTDHIRKNRRTIEGAGIADIDQLGMLIKKHGDTDTYTLTSAWRFTHDKSVGMGTYQTHLILGDELPPLMTPVQQRLYKDGVESGADPVLVREIAARTVWLPSSYLIATMKKVNPAIINRPELFAQRWGMMEEAMLAQGINSLQQSTEEDQFLFGAWLLLFNAKSGIRKKEFSIEQKQKRLSFGSRKKKMSTVHHKYTVISMSDYENEDGSESLEHAINKRKAHYVRGHFKQRATGLFWWNSFMRNRTEQYTPREAYIVNG